MTGYRVIKKGRKGFIRPLPPLVLSKYLENKLRYTKQGAEFMPNPRWAEVKLYKIKTASFPWGLLNEVKEIISLWKNVRDDEFTYHRQKSVAYNLNYHTSNKLRAYQFEAITKLIENKGGMLSMPTGSGKTFTCLEYLKCYEKKTLVIVPTIYLVNQWKKQTEDYVDVRTYQGIKDFSILDQYEIVVFDECHHVAASTLWKLAMKLKEQIVVGLSATPYREDGEDMKIYGALGKIVYDISMRELIKQGYLCDAEVKFIELSQHDSEFYQTYQEIYKDYIVNNEERNIKIINSIIHNPNKKILVLVGEIAHGEILLRELHISEDDAIFLNSKSKKMDTDHRILIATSIFDEGVDLPHLDMIIMAAGGKSGIKCTQRIGRVLRTHEGKKKALIIDFVDRAKYLFKHYEKRKILYEEYGFNREII